MRLVSRLVVMVAPFGIDVLYAMRQAHRDLGVDVDVGEARARRADRTGCGRRGSPTRSTT